MNEIQESAIIALKKWFDKAENWQKDLFVQLWQGNEDIDKLISRGFSLAKNEYLGEKTQFAAITSFPKGVELSGSENCPLILEKISDVQGVGALSPTRSLDFGRNLTVVYGENGCGKSSYVKILKSAASPKSKQTILNNVYKEQNKTTQATLTYSDDGQEQIVNWKPGMKVSCPLNIYDTSVAKQFAEQKNEVVYEPRILSLLSSVVNTYQEIAKRFDSLITENDSQISLLDSDIETSELISKFKSINSTKALDSFLKSVDWTDKDNNELEALKAGLQQQNPNETLKTLKAQNTVINNEYDKLINLSLKLGESFSKKYLLERKRQIETKNEADKIIETIKQISLLENTGTDKWKEMWNSASRYADKKEQKAEFPIELNGRCVLCQQELGDEARTRIEKFTECMTSNANVNAQRAFNAFEMTVRTLQDTYNSINIDNVELTLKASNASDELTNPIINAYKKISNRCQWLLNYSDSESTKIPELSSVTALQEEKERIGKELSSRITAIQSIIDDRNKQVERYKYLLALKWIYENKECRRKDILLKKSTSKCKTNTVTTLKKDLTELLITNTYINRFQEEMDSMDLQHKIRVELVSRGAEKGRSYHQVALKGAVGEGKKKSTGEVLSEGEYRVVSLAAFLADLSSWNRVLPFVFDDPINSLDHKYEQRVANRLVTLSSERQVIVFTHRLAFAQLLLSCVDEYNKQKQDDDFCPVDIKQIELRSKPLGEPVNPKYRGATSMKNALNLMKQKEIVELKRMIKSGDYENLDKGIQSLCSDFRKIIEQGIETDLLQKIVTRFGYSVNSLRLRYLYEITKEDIDKFDNMMTKYSAFEHSQSTERPINLPEVSEIETDIDDMLKWCKDFNKRCDDANKKK